jgi:hypothetical protein
MGRGWKIVYGSVTGTSHQMRGEGCQDYITATVATGRDGEAVLVAACADGAGSAPHSRDGARLACQTFVRCAVSELEGGLAVGDIDSQRALGWQDAACRALALEACLRNLSAREFACTLLAGVVGIRRAVFTQVGDGAIVLREGASYRTVFWPQNGEYANTTFFLTDPDFECRALFAATEGDIGGLALFTDGIQPLALHNATRSVHAPFFEPMFVSLSANQDPDELTGPLKAFLGSEPVNRRTDDDKSLLLAARASDGRP